MLNLPRINLSDCSSGACAATFSFGVLLGVREIHCGVFGKFLIRIKTSGYIGIVVSVRISLAIRARLRVWCYPQMTLYAGATSDVLANQGPVIETRNSIGLRSEISM